MKQIVGVHFPNLKKELLGAALKNFYDVRNLPGLKKKPSTSELLDWLKLLVAEDIPLEALQSKDDKVAVPPLVGALLEERAGRVAVREARLHAAPQPLSTASSGRRMQPVRPVTLASERVRLEPLGLQHVEGLKRAAADGELWTIRVTSVPEPDDTRGYVERALQAFAEGHRPRVRGARRAERRGDRLVELPRHRSRGRAARDRLHLVREEPAAHATSTPARSCFLMHARVRDARRQAGRLAHRQLQLRQPARDRAARRAKKDGVLRHHARAPRRHDPRHGDVQHDRRRMAGGEGPRLLRTTGPPARLNRGDDASGPALCRRAWRARVASRVLLAAFVLPLHALELRVSVGRRASSRASARRSPAFERASGHTVRIDFAAAPRSCAPPCGRRARGRCDHRPARDARRSSPRPSTAARRTRARRSVGSASASPMRPARGAARHRQRRDAEGGAAVRRHRSCSIARRPASTSSAMLQRLRHRRRGARQSRNACADGASVMRRLLAGTAQREFGFGAMTEILALPRPGAEARRALAGGAAELHDATSRCRGPARPHRIRRATPWSRAASATLQGAERALAVRRRRHRPGAVNDGVSPRLGERGRAGMSNPDMNEPLSLSSHARRPTPAYLRHPTLHGDRIAFVADDDLWTRRAPTAASRGA